MKRAAALALLAACGAQAGMEWSPAVEVGAVAGRTVFHHLESANRQGLAESSGRVALVWEDNRDGEPRCWLAVREALAPAFSAPQPVAGAECYEPVVQGMADGRFVVAWEAEGAVWARRSDGGGAVRLSEAEAAHVSLARVDARSLYAAWAERAGPHRRIVLARLALTDTGLEVESRLPLEDRPPADDQAYPALAAQADGSVVALWEDRRFRHTAMLASHSADGRTFSPPFRVIDVPTVRTIDLGAGMGSMRPGLAPCGANCVAAVWLDKRDFLSGYDVYAAFSRDGGRSFGRNLKVQDSFGDNVAQWHAAIGASSAGRVAVAWDDARDGTADVWLSLWDGRQFSDDLAVPAASGPGEQSDPLILLDNAGVLHLAWLDKSAGGASRLMYASASWRE